ncbi:MAG: Ig-like domain-containing protein [Clostridiales bacterium]|nr:Ig-like domain-containing protein [Clostridiales bacterium]
MDDIADATETIEVNGTYTLPDTITVTYSSGDVAESVEWAEDDLAAIDVTTPGTYVVNGTVTLSQEVTSGDYAGATTAAATYTLTVKYPNLLDEDDASFEISSTDAATKFTITGSGVDLPATDDPYDGTYSMHWYLTSATTSSVTYNVAQTLSAGDYTFECVAQGYAGDTVTLQILDEDGEVLFEGDATAMTGWAVWQTPTVSFTLTEETTVTLRIVVSMQAGGWGTADCLYLYKTGEAETHTHTYGEPVFTWEDDYSAAAAAFTCTEGDDTQTVEADVTSEVTKEATATATGVRTYTATDTFHGATYTDEQTETIPATATDIADCTVTVANATYTGKAQTPAVTVKDANGNILTKDTDYKVDYTNNTNAGTATVTVTGIGNYTGSVSKTFTIAKANQTVTAKAAATTIYAGKTTTITASTTGDGAIKYTSSDTSIATVSSKGVVTGVKPGTVTITVQAASTTNYNASSKKTFSITVKLSSTTISSLTNTSSGITVKWGKVAGASGYYVYRKTSGGSYSKIATIKSGSTVSYTDTSVKNKNGTTYVYAVRAYYGSTLGGYTGKTTVRLTAVSLSCLKNVKTKKMTVKWKKNCKATGYQIQYSTSSDFSSYKTVTVSSYKTVKKTISKLTKGKKYYVRVRAYKTVSGTKYYSAWSSTKSVTIKK